MSKNKNKVHMTMKNASFYSTFKTYPLLLPYNKLTQTPTLQDSTKKAGPCTNTKLTLKEARKGFLPITMRVE